MNRIHFRMGDELLSQVEEYMKKHNFNRTQAVISLIKASLNNQKEELAYKKIMILLDKLNSRNNFNRTLLEQLYSDLEIESLTDPKKNKALQELKTKKFKDSFND